jgi:hypothetical protein
MARPPTDSDHLNGDANGDAHARPMPNRRSEEAVFRPVKRPRGLRAMLTREFFWGATKTLSWLVPLTVATWIYAEREQNVFPKGYNAIGIAVQVRASTDDWYVELADTRPGQTATVDLKLSGPQEGVQAVSQDLATHGGLKIDLGSRPTPGPNQPLNVVALIRDMPLFRRAGVSVDEASELRVNVEAVEELRGVVVKVDPNVRTVAEQSTFNPPEVAVRGPRSQLAALEQFEQPPDGRPFVYADLSRLSDRLRPGDVPLEGVPLALPLGGEQVRQVRILPPTVAAKLRVRAADESAVIDPVPLVIVATQATLKQYDVTVNNGDPSLRSVHVSGPPAAIADLIAKRFPVKAEVDVDPGDAPHQEPKHVRFFLPPGVTASPEDAAQTVPIEMKPRENGG